MHSAQGQSSKPVLKKFLHLIFSPVFQQKKRHLKPEHDAKKCSLDRTATSPHLISLLVRGEKIGVHTGPVEQKLLNSRVDSAVRRLQRPPRGPWEGTSGRERDIRKRLVRPQSAIVIAFTRHIFNSNSVQESLHFITRNGRKMI